MRERLEGRRWSTRNRTLAWLIALVLCLPLATASASAPPPLPQSSTDKTFAAGSYIIDAGWMGSPAAATQPKTALEQYGLIYRLLVNEKIPVYWIIANDKTGVVGSAPSLANTTADLVGVNVYTPYTSTALTTKSYYSGPFVIPAEYLTDARLTTILAAATAITGVRVDKAAAEFTAPVYDKVTYWPKATLDSQNGSIAQGFYTNAKIPASVYSYNWKAPSELNPCDDVFVMPHADPTWAIHNNLIPFNDQGGYIWAGCHAASVLENIDSPLDTDLNPNMNFLTSEGLLDFGDHGGGSVPYYYGSELDVKPWTSLTVPGTGTVGTTVADRSDPVMQIIGATELAHQNGSEQIYMPNPETMYPSMTGVSRWNPGVRFISWDPTQADVIAAKSPGVAAVDLYGRGFDDPTNGLVMYQGGHSLNKGTVGDTPAQRAFFNFLLLGGIERAPEVEIDRSALPTYYQSGGQVPITAFIDPLKGSAPFTYTWQSTCGGTFSSTGGTTTGGNVSTVWNVPAVNTPTPCQFRIVAVDSCDRQVFDAVGLTVMPVADLRITKTGSAAAVTTGSNITYTLTVTNLGPATSEGVVVTDTLPAGLSYVSATPAPANVTGQVVTFNLGSLAKDAVRTLTVTAKANQGGVTVQNVAVVSATTPDPNMTNNTATANTQVINSGISITKTARPEIVPAAGGLVTYEFVVRNVGDNPVSNVVVTDNPACATMSGPTGDLNNDGKLDPPYLGVDREIWRYTCTRTVDANTPDVEKAAGETTVANALDALTNTKQDVVKATATDSADNALTAKAWTTVTVSTPAISVTKSLSPTTQAPAPGQDATFRVVVSNTGNVPLSTVDTTDIWAGSCDTASIPNLPVGGSFEMVCTAKTPTSPTLTTVATDSFPTSTWPTGWTTTNGITLVDGSALPTKATANSYVVSHAANKTILTRSIDLSGAVGASLEFAWLRSAAFNQNTGGLEVKVSSDGGVTFSPTVVTITGTGGNNALADSQWSTGTLNLTGYTSANTVIQFVAKTDLRNRPLYIDDVVIKKGAVVNSIDATGKGPFGESVTATATAPVTPGNPSLSITKTASTAGPVSIGGTFNYTVTVKNTGTVTQTGLVVTDTWPAGLSYGTVSAVKPSFTQTASDDFGTTGTAVYTTGSGWLAAWDELDDDDTATGGKIRIDTGKGDPKYSLNFDKPGNNTAFSIQRSLDLTGATSATLSLRCSREDFNSADDYLEIWIDGTKVETISDAAGTTTTQCPQDNGSTFGTIGPITFTPAAGGTTILLKGSGDKEIYVDNVVVTATYPSTTVTAGNPPTLTSAGGPYILEPNATVTFTIPVTVTAAPTGGFQFNNLVEATSLQQTTPVQSAVVTPYKLMPSFDITKTAIETWVNQSGDVLYRVEVKNTGNKALQMTSISDPNCNAPLAGPTGDINADGWLQMGEIWRYTCTRSVSTPSSPPAPDDVPNTAMATMTDGTTSLTKKADANVKVIHPAINLTVDPMTKTVLTGGTVSYTYTLTNTGDIDITNPAVAAANCTPVTYSGGDSDNDGVLDTVETWTYTCTTGALTANQTSQAVTATGKDLIFASAVTDTENVAVTVIDPKIAVVKTAQNNASGGLTADSITVGYPNSVTYHYAVTNTGNVALSAVSGLDNKCQTVAAVRMGADIIGDTHADGAFDPGEIWQFACGPVQLETDTTNSVQFNATYLVDGLTGTVSATDTAHVDVMRPKLVVTKEASATRARIGGDITYTYLITNTGATSFLRSGFSTPVLTDDKCADVTFSRWLVDRDANEVLDPPIPADPNNPADLGAPGDVIEYTCTTEIGTAPATVVDDRVVNTVTTGPATDTLGSTFTPTPATASVFVINPDFTLTKVATTTNQNGSPQTGDNIDGEAGKPVLYTFTITHSITTPSGNFLDNLNALSLVIQDPDPDRDPFLPQVCAAQPVAVDADQDGVIDGDTNANGLLNPGEVWTYTCTLNALPSGEPTVNTVKVTGTVVERTLNDDGTPAEPDDGLGPIVKTDTATVTPFGRVVTVLKRGLNCDVGVPSCVMTFSGSEFMLYRHDPAGPTPGVGEPLTSEDGSATFVTAKLQPNADYWLVETKAPDGFQLLAQPVKFRLTVTTLTLDPATASSLITADGSNFTITVTDVPAAELPKAGGEGMLPYLGLGLLLVAGATTYYRVTSRPPIAPRRAM